MSGATDREERLRIMREERMKREEERKIELERLRLRSDRQKEINETHMKEVREVRDHMLAAAQDRSVSDAASARELRAQRAQRLAEERERRAKELEERASGQVATDDFEERMAERQRAREERERQRREEEEQMKQRRELRKRILLGDAVDGEPLSQNRSPTTARSERLSAPSSSPSNEGEGELVEDNDGEMVHPKVLCSRYARTIKELQAKIVSLENSVNGTNEINKQMSEEISSLKSERTELYERLEPYEKAKDTLFKKELPIITTAIPEEISKEFSNFAVGTKALAKFSSTEYIVVTILEDKDDKVVVNNEGDSEEIRKKNLFPLIENVLTKYKETESVENALRCRINEMDEKFKAHIKEIEKEMKELKENNEKLKEVYSVDIRKLFYEEDNVNKIVQSYENECRVACHIIDVMDTAVEYQRGSARWLTPSDGNVKLWGPLSESNETIVDPPPAKRKNYARLFQFYQNELNKDEISEILNFNQSDLSADKCYILDTNDEIYVYSGSNASLEDKFKATNTALGVAKFDKAHGKQTAVVNVDDSNIPLRFRLRFDDWQDVTPPEAKVEVNNEGTKEVYEYKELLNRESLPLTVDRSRLEDYMTSAEFANVFGMRRSKFVTLPGWKRAYLKRKFKLF